MISIADAARRYAARGWRLVPLRRGGKIPLLAQWATAPKPDEAFITKWFELDSANLGIVTGPPSSLFVVDIDMRDGLNGWDSLQMEFGQQVNQHEGLAVRTASGGLHLYFQWDNAAPAKTCAGILPGVDVRGLGGQAVLPPSIIFNTKGSRPYAWATDEDAAPAVAPEWVKRLLTLAQPKSRLDLDGVVSGLPAGSRDDQIYRYACHLRHRGIEYGLAMGFILAAADRAQPPFDRETAKAKLDRAYKDQ